MRYQTLREAGISRREAARSLKISYDSAARFDNGEISTVNAKRAKKVKDVVDDISDVPLAYDQLGPEAVTALEDFSYFRSRYLGRRTIPWQVEAANTIVSLLETPHKEWAVINVPPGSGKSTTFTHDIPLWLICRDRSVRIMIGSKTGRQARAYTARLKRTLERQFVFEGADAALADEFGPFVPAISELWRAEEFIVWQTALEQPVEKEPTVSAYGMDAGFLGGRFDFVIWDDLVDSSTIGTDKAREDQRSWYEDEAETRLEPGGLFVLQGQRLSPNDLYRYALDMPSEDPDVPKYRHVIYKAHYDEDCVEDHERDQAAWPDGCLLDPVRLPWRDLMAAKERNPRKFDVVYQQQDLDPEGVLVPREYVDGGEYNGMLLPGCKDLDRHVCELPDYANHDGAISVATVDPSPTKFWAIQWWVYDPTTEHRILMDCKREMMAAPEFLDRAADGTHTGVAEEWQRRSQVMGIPIEYWVVEAVAAQRFMLQYASITDWATSRGTTFIAHHTGVNKADPDFGVQTVAPEWRWGRIRLPWGDPHARMVSSQLVDEVTVWPEGNYDDQVMAHWFCEYTLPDLASSRVEVPKRKVPSWL